MKQRNQYLQSKIPALIVSTPLAFPQAIPAGYGKSKSVAGRVLERAVKDSGVRAKMMLIGQIIPSRKDRANNCGMLMG
jgi:hypothetical protein